jgi:hypothetical protein
VYLLWHEERPIGICVFGPPPLALRPRNRYFGLSGQWTRLGMRAMNAQLLSLLRVVLHPAYRGAGLAAAFVRRCCTLTGSPWIESLAQMGRANPFLERAGFVRVGECANRKKSAADHATIYGGKDRPRRSSAVSEETFRKSLFAAPVYYVLDNREMCN